MRTEPSLKLRSLAVSAALTLAAVSQAKPPFLKVFFDTYNISSSSRLGRARCLNCHLGAPPVLNPYGKQVYAALSGAKARMVTSAILKSIEGKTSGSGLTNLTRIHKDVLPGQPKAIKKRQSRSDSAAMALLIPLLAAAAVTVRRGSDAAR